MHQLRFLTFFSLAVNLVVAHVPVVADDNSPPEGFVALFNGNDLSGWKGLVADPKKRAELTPDQLEQAQVAANAKMQDHWTVVDGMIRYDGLGGHNHLCTVNDFGDFELLVDWKISKGGDSGIYLRGAPQVQIWDREEGSAGLYNNKEHPSKPSTVADKPVGEWNTFRIRMVGANVTVHLNDQLVVDNVVMENYWERDKPIYPSGQIELQSHGSELFFKNIYIREIAGP